MSPIINYLYCSLFTTLSIVAVLGQGNRKNILPNSSKPVLDSSVMYSWLGLTNNPMITKDGKFYAYSVSFRYHRRYNDRKLIVSSLDGTWGKEFIAADQSFFSTDSKELIVQKKDTLFFVRLGTNKIDSVLHTSLVKSPYGTSETMAGAPFMAWIEGATEKVLVLKDLLSGEERRIEDVIDYLFSNGGESILMRAERKVDGIRDISLIWMFLSNLNNINTIWDSRSGSTVGAYCMDAKGQQVLFSVNETSEKTNNTSIWYYRSGMDKATEKANDQTKGIDANLKLDGGCEFSPNERYILITLKEKDLPKPALGFESVDVWNYKDKVIQATQLHDLGPKTYKAVISSDGQRVIRLQGEHDLSPMVGGDYMLVNHDENGERFWQYGIYKKYFLVSLKDGLRKEVKGDWDKDFWFSPDGNYVVYFRDDKYYSYDLESGKDITISGTIPNGYLSFISDEFAYPGTNLNQRSAIGIAGWVENDESLLVYDEYDIWELDLTGKKSSINVTNGYGRRNHVKLRFVYSDGESKSAISRDHPLLLGAFNVRTKYNGFYWLKMGVHGDPELLVVKPWAIDLNLDGRGSPQTGDVDAGMIPVKAFNSDTWLVRSSSPAESPNYYLTRDFKKYEQLTHLQPEKSYNWYTTELVTYPQLDGKINQGVLYKPEDFDPKKKYPLIIQYYEKFSQTAYGYLQPGFCQGMIDVPWFVSHGYLVFRPDIQYKIGRPGRSTVNSIEGAGQYLSKRSYVDSKRIGLSGHSWSGFETNYLVTHSHIFAAAIAGAGSSDWISAPLSLGKGDDDTPLYLYESIIGARLWQRPDLWLDNTPVLSADKVTTPLLIFHNKADNHWEQAVEMFITMRRLDKKCWLLQYDHGAHVVFGKDAEDYTIRTQQFFDHYLKGAPAPKWMTEGIPAKMKGIDSGLELDYSGEEP